MVDPGEYGVESMQVRFVCTYIFVLTGLFDFYYKLDGLRHTILYTLHSSHQCAALMDAVTNGDDMLLSGSAGLDEALHLLLKCGHLPVQWVVRVLWLKSRASRQHWDVPQHRQYIRHELSSRQLNPASL